MDIKEYCEAFYNFCFIPIYYYENCECRFALHSHKENVSIPKMIEDLLFERDKEIDILETVIHSYYGRIRLGKGDKYFIIGPIYQNEYNEGILRKFFYKYHVKKDRQAYFADEFFMIPAYTLLQFNNLLQQISLVFCGRKGSIHIYHDLNEMNVQNDSLAADRQREQEKEYAANMNLQRKIYAPLIQEGNIEGLIERSKQGIPLKLGEYSDNLKDNQFIIFMISLTNTMNAAVDGGMPEQEAYLLAKYYIAQCLNAKDAALIDEISMKATLNYVLQVRNYKDEQISHSVLYRCVQYIRSHTYSPITVSDVAKYAGYSEGHFSRMFKGEMGFGAAEFIYNCKLLEAKILLEMTTLSVGEISENLYFSNQSHFQRKFKTKFHVTPLQYRLNGDVNK